MPISYRSAQTLIKRGDTSALGAALADGLNPNLANENGWSLLMLAAVEGNAELGRLLINRGANLVASNLKGQTPESIAKDRGHTSFLALLEEFNAPPA